MLHEWGAGLPGIFDINSGSSSQEDAEAHIRYRIVSECDVAGFFNRDIKSRQMLVVQQKLVGMITDAKMSAEENVGCYERALPHVRACMPGDCTSW